MYTPHVENTHASLTTISFSVTYPLRIAKHETTPIEKKHPWNNCHICLTHLGAILAPVGRTPQRGGVDVNQKEIWKKYVRSKKSKRTGFQCCSNKWVFPKIMVPQNGWFIMEKPINMHDFGVKNPNLWKHPNVSTYLTMKTTNFQVRENNCESPNWISYMWH